MKSQGIEFTLYLSYDISVWVRPVAAAMEGFGIFSAVLPEYTYFHFAIPPVNRVE
jgi:hypothetical protein